ncbi:MAG TPA: hypothetical protein VIS07_11615 [Candidatus Binatia bacterium]
MSTRRVLPPILVALTAALSIAVAPIGPRDADAAQGTLVSACKGTIGCPNKVILRGAVDVLQFHADITPQSPINPPAEHFTLTLSNANGVIFSETLGANQFKKSGNRFQFRDPHARKSFGFSRVTIRKRPGANTYRIDLIAHGDMAAATLPLMAVEIAIGDDTFFTQNVWQQKAFGWQLHLPAVPATPTPTPIVTPSPTPSPSPMPPTPTPSPSPTPAPPTPTPSPSPTPAPPTPSPSPSPTPTQNPYGSAFNAFVAAPASLLD